MFVILLFPFFSEDVGAWLKMTDQGDSIMAISSYAGANSRKRDAEAAKEAAKSTFASSTSSAALPPLASLSRLAAPSLAPLQERINHLLWHIIS